MLFSDDFLGDSVRDLWRVVADGAGTAVVVDAQDGGIVRITTDTSTNNDVEFDWGDIHSLLVSKKVTIEYRAKLNQTTNQLLQLQLSNVFTERVYFYTDTAADNNWHIVCRSVATTDEDTGITVDTDYHVFRIECFPTGEVHFYYDGAEVTNSPITTNITASYLQPIIFFRTLENAAKSLDVDYIIARQEI